MILLNQDVDIDADRELEVPATWDIEPNSDAELSEEVFEDIEEELVQRQACQGKTSIKERYSDNTWISDHNTFDPTPAEFTGPAPGITCSFQTYPTMSQLWNMPTD